MIITDRAAYIATALSDDHKMGFDSAIECVNENGQVKAYTSITQTIPNNYSARRSEIVSQTSQTSKATTNVCINFRINHS